MLLESVLGKKWQQKPYDQRLALTIYQKFNQKLGLSEIISRLLALKGIALEEVEEFLSPAIKSALPDPFLLLDMDIAVNKIIDAIKGQKKIVIFGDYDVDGATSSALLKRFFAAINVEVEIYIPDRILEGYGPNANALLKLRSKGADLVITVDCGTVAFEPLNAAHEAGLEIIVIDHHLGALEKPKAIAVINPNRLDELFTHKYLAAVGVCFLLVVALNKSLREQGFYQQNNLSEPQLISLLDLVALGTVCDVVPLLGVNRAFVSQGLKVMKARQNLGLRTLFDLATLNEEPNSYHLGFVIGPRINAGGRVGKSDLGARLLATVDEDEAKEIAVLLQNYNQQRKAIEEQVLEEAKEQVTKNKLYQLPVIIAAGENWHQGVIGIVASRIKDLYNRPTAIVSIKDGIGKASCRSINGVDFGSVVIKARIAGLLIEGGGHAMAAGFAVQKLKIEDLVRFFCQELKEFVDLELGNQTAFFSDILDINSANLNLVKEIKALEPFGACNSRPRFMIKDLLIIKADVIGSGNNHVRCVFSAKNQLGLNGRITGIAFDAMKSDLGLILVAKNKSQPINVIGQVNLNNWLGNESVQILIEDIIR